MSVKQRYLARSGPDLKPKRPDLRPKASSMLQRVIVCIKCAHSACVPDAVAVKCSNLETM